MNAPQRANSLAGTGGGLLGGGIAGLVIGGVFLGAGVATPCKLGESKSCDTAKEVMDKQKTGDTFVALGAVFLVLGVICTVGGIPLLILGSQQAAAKQGRVQLAPSGVAFTF
jgi:hypothetical protein